MSTYRLDFVLKIDTDALVIGPFAAKLEAAISSHPKVGTLGVLGTSCNREVRSYYWDAKVKLQTTIALEIGRGLHKPLSRNGLVLEHLILEQWGIRADRQIAAFAQVCELLAPLLKDGFTGSHCQGGSYAISALMISRMADFGLLADPNIWTQWPFGEDQMMGTVCSGVGLQTMDFSSPNEPFGVQCGRVAFPPHVLVECGYSIVHSIKNDFRYPELEATRILRKYEEAES